MSKKPTTFTEKDRKNYEEGQEETPKTFVDPEHFITKEIPNASEPPKADNGPSWDSEEHIWSASRARKVADTYEVRNFKKGLQDIMRYVKTAANSGQYECAVYNDNICADIAIDSIINALEERGYTVNKNAQYNGWYIKISW